MEQRILLLFARPYSMRDEDGRMIEGVSIRYLAVGDLKPVFGQDGSKGVNVSKDSLPVECLPKISAAPAFYTATFTMAPNAQGKLMLKVQDLKFDEVLDDEI